VTSLLTASDHALYRAKSLGRNRVEAAHAAMQAEMPVQN
jgi:PleD family two-component response regulator